MLAPVILFVYNRPEHTIKTIEALSKNLLAKETTVYIFSDAAKNKESLKKVEKVREYIDSIKEKGYFKAIIINKEKSNKGLARSVIEGVNKIISEQKKVIVLEDDLISAPNFLTYMNEALDYYRDFEKVWSISGYNIPIEIPKSYKSDVFYSYRGCSWGWATWEDKWKQVDWEVKDYNSFKKDKKLIKRFNRGGRDMKAMLDAQMEGSIDSWAIRWCYTQSKRELFTVYPVKSLIKNIGLDGSGTHSGYSSHYDVEIGNLFSEIKFNDPELNSIIIRNFQNHYGTQMKHYFSNKKNIIKKILK